MDEQTLANGIGKILSPMIGDRLKKIREKKGMSQRELAARMWGRSASRNSIYQIEQGCTGLTLKLLFSISMALEIEPKRLLPSRREISAKLSDDLKTKIAEQWCYISHRYQRER